MNGLIEGRSNPGCSYVVSAGPKVIVAGGFQWAKSITDENGERQSISDRFVSTTEIIDLKIDPNRGKSLEVSNKMESHQRPILAMVTTGGTYDGIQARVQAFGGRGKKMLQEDTNRYVEVVEEFDVETKKWSHAHFSMKN